jgi:hypothetical protein
MIQGGMGRYCGRRPIGAQCASRATTPGEAERRKKQDSNSALEMGQDESRQMGGVQAANGRAVTRGGEAPRVTWTMTAVGAASGKDYSRVINLRRLRARDGQAGRARRRVAALAVLAVSVSCSLGVV